MGCEEVLELGSGDGRLELHEFFGGCLVLANNLDNTIRIQTNLLDAGLNQVSDDGLACDTEVRLLFQLVPKER